VEYFQTPELAITIIHAEEKIAENIYQWIKDNRAKLIGNLSRKRRVRELGRRMDWRRQIPREQMTALRKAMRLSLDAVIASSMR
jgi:hypothetical protein